MSYTEIKRQGILFCLVGPSAGGKTSMGAYLLKQFATFLSLSISATTRAPRETEKDGIDYLFISREEFKEKIEAGLFFEWAQVHGNYYGTFRDTVTEAVNQGKDLLLDIDLQGIKSFKEAFPDNTIVTFIAPPSVEELKKRMQQRNLTSEKELERRLETAKSEYAQLQDLAEDGLVEYFIINDDRNLARNLIASIYQAERLRVKRMALNEIRRLCSI